MSPLTVFSGEGIFAHTHTHTSTLLISCVRFVTINITPLGLICYVCRMNAGCPGILVEEQLVCDRSLKIEIQEYMLRQRSSNVDTVADCTYLEEDDDTPLKSSGSR